MEATQNHVDREAPRAAGGLRRSIRYLVAPAIAALIGLGAHLASADTVSPSGVAFTAVSKKVTIKVGTSTITYTSSTFSGAVPSPTPSGMPVCTPISNPSFTGGTINSSGVTFPTTTSTSGSWQFCWSNAGPSCTLTIPQNGLRITASILGSACTITTTAATTLSGAWSNATSSCTFTNAGMPVVTSGGFPCPSATSATFSATYTFTPALTVGP